ncbi:hypothetical protein G5I_00452 [Acromyrmex echinatior]|uniref:Uncharacterized protein n=1 Tax=Acromyrmex echinatior TaxID=103372 RepID=F4W4X0_ACREC|nr:hypothetical protein G5I_00452 [Acromyrmex echinatior]
MMAQWSFRSCRALALSAFFARISAVNFPACSEFRAGLPLDLFMNSPSESEKETMNSAILLRLFSPKDPSEAVDPALDKTASARAPTLLQAGPGRDLRGFSLVVERSSSVTSTRAYFRHVFAKVYPHPSLGKPGEGALSSPGELAHGTGPRNVSSGTLASSPLPTLRTKDSKKEDGEIEAFIAFGLGFLLGKKSNKILPQTQLLRGIR